MTLPPTPTVDVRTTSPVPSWLGLHCHLHWQPSDVDTFLTDTVAPILDALQAAGRIDGWFFIRYGEGGPHLRIRVLGADPATGDRLRADLVRLIAQAPHPVLALDEGEAAGPARGRSPAAWHRHGDVLVVAYDAEVDRYGGPDALPVAEEVFCHSTAVAVRTIATARTAGARLIAAAELTIATSVALGLDPLAAARWLRSHAAGWRWQTEAELLPSAVGQARAAGILAAQAPALRRRWQRVRELVDSDGPADATSPLRRWADAVRAARARLEDDPDVPASGRWLAVWASQLHMLLNRLGITPDEERSVCWLVAGTALAPDGITPFFADGPDAPDRRYLEASKYLPGQLDAQRPSEEHSPPAWRPPTRQTVLPMAELGAVPLADALRRRESARGRLVGPVSARELGTLVWNAYGATGVVPVNAPDGTRHAFARRPYPSGGQKYPARLRLIARDVTGLEPGCYDSDPVPRTLSRIGPAPSDADLEATSMWFGATAVKGGGAGITELPAMLGLSVRLPATRTRYGLRGLRSALLEAGHLAQNLALVAAATGLSLGMIGAFYDDLAHEVFGLDGVDEILVYLLPVGR